MKIRQTPGGTWCGTEKDYIKAMRSEGIDPKNYTGRIFVEVPTDKAGLMEFLTFHNVNAVNPGASGPAPGHVTTGEHTPPAPVSPVVTPGTTMSDLDELFAAAPLGQQLTLASIACENAYKAVG